MTAIGKWFNHEGESFTVAEQTINGYVCRSHVDKKLWVFSFPEIRKILANVDPLEYNHNSPEEL